MWIKSGERQDTKQREDWEEVLLNETEEMGQAKEEAEKVKLGLGRFHLLPA
jgi:hypothetical protein